MKLGYLDKALAEAKKGIETASHYNLTPNEVSAFHCNRAGLFAGQNFGSGDVITSYEGPILYRDEAEDSSKDTSYVLRIPDSGGALIDGKPIGDAIRKNPNNPGAWGRYYPAEGAVEWHQGAASKANDPRDSKLYNSRLHFVRRQGANKAVRAQGEGAPNAREHQPCHARMTVMRAL